MNRKELEKKLKEACYKTLKEAYTRDTRPTKELPSVKRPKNMETKELIEFTSEQKRKMEASMSRAQQDKKVFDECVATLKSRDDFEQVAQSMGLMQETFDEMCSKRGKK